MHSPSGFSTSGVSTVSQYPRQASGMNWGNMGGSARASLGMTTMGAQQQNNNNNNGSSNLQQGERLIGSTILKEEFLNGMPLQDQIKYVEVPVIEEVIRHVPRKEYVEVEKRVPRYEYEWVERIVEIPQIQYVDRHVEVPQIQEVLRHVPIRQVVDVPKEILKYVPKIETKYIEKEIEVPGEIIEIPKPYIVENKVMIPKFVDQEVATVVAQRLHPRLTESETDFQDVDVKEFNPYLVPVDVYLPKPVARQVIAAQKTQEHHVVDIPVAHFNALLKSVNPGLTDADLEGRLITVNGIAPVAYGLGVGQVIPPQSGEWQAQRVPGQIHVIPVNGMSFSNANTSTSTTTLNYSTTQLHPSTTMTSLSHPMNITSTSTGEYTATSHQSQAAANVAIRTLMAQGGSMTPMGLSLGAPGSTTTTYHSTSIGGPTMISATQNGRSLTPISSSAGSRQTIYGSQGVPVRA